MRMTSIAVCALPGLLLGVCLAATAAEPQQPKAAAHTQPAIDAKTGRLLRPLTTHERKNLSADVASRQRLVKQPRTETEAKPTLVRAAGGDLSMQVPTELWSHLAAQQDAQGHWQVHESEGAQAPVIAVEGPGHE